MVAVVAGAGLGLERSSAWVLGSRGLLGQAQLGRGADNVYVNAATGNLIVQGQDEMLIGVGQNDPVSRTYNSLGTLSDDNGDNWRESVSRQVSGLTGTGNTAGSTVTLTDWDGSDVTFTWSAARSAYVSTQGAGAYDTLTYAGSTWTLTDGSSQVKETYDASNGGRITTSADVDGNTLTYAYNASGLVSRVTTQDGEYTAFIYSGNNLTQVQTWRHPDAAGAQALAQTTRVDYAYDASNRLTSVTVDLSPQDNSVSDGKVYVTTYGYDGTSRRLTSISQTDGSSLQIAYTQVAGVYRVQTLTQAAASGQARTTSFAYDTTNRVTTVTDPMGFATQLAYDASGQLTKITAPAAGGAAAEVTQFSYTANGDVATVTAADGGVSTYGYDANGNRISEVDGAGDQITRTFNAANLPLTETTYPNGGAGTTTRYVYDSENHLRFIITPQGEVTERRYNAAGQQTSEFVYAASTYDVSALSATQSPSESSLMAWVSGLTNLTASQRTDIAYDFRGNVATVTNYERLTSSGAGDTTGAVSVTTYVYDQSGRLLSERTPTAAAPKTYVYDGLGRVIVSTDYAGAQTSVAFNDAASTTVVTLANGLTRTLTYDLAGELISYSEAGPSVATATTTYAYDADGRLRRVTDPTGIPTYHLYDALGRKTADIAADGTIVEYAYTLNDQLATTVRYADKLTPAQLASLTNADGTPANVAVASIRPAADPDDRWDWKVYDADQRLVETIDAAGDVTAYQYDGASNLIGQTQYATPLDDVTLASLKGLSSSGAGSSAAPVAGNDSGTTTANQQITFTPLANDVDANGYTLSISGVGTPAHGQAVQTGNQIVYTPANDYTGSDSFTYSISDGHGGTSTATISVTVTPAVPANAVTVSSTAALSAALAAAHAGDTILLAAGTYDGVGLDNLTFSSAVTLQSADTAHQAVIENLEIGGSSHLTLSYLHFTDTGDNFATIQGSSDHISFSHDTFIGLVTGTGNALLIRDSDSVIVTASDFGQFWSGINEVDDTNLTITNNVFHDLTAQAIRGTDVVNETISGNAFLDADPTITDHSDVIYLWQDNTANNVTITGNTYGAPASTNTAPVAANDSGATTANQPITFSPLANDVDADGDTLTITAVGAPAHGAAVQAGSQIVYTPASGYTGSDSFTYTISDGHGGTSTATISVTVTPAVPANAVTVSSTAALSAALAAAHAGDTILLAAGTYDGVGLYGLNFSGAVTIRSADASNQAVIENLDIDGSSNLVLSYLHFTDTGDNFATIDGNSNNITFSNDTFVGFAIGTGNALQIRNSDSITVTRSDFGVFWSGINEVDDTNLTITNNAFHDLTAEAIRGTSVVNETISGNAFVDADPTNTSHSDVINLWQDNTANNVTITGNTYGAPAGGDVGPGSGGSGGGSSGNAGLGTYAGPAAAALVSVAASASDRTTRSFYDADGRLIGSLDSGGYLTQNRYDAAGRLVETVGYGGATTASLRAAGSFAALLTSAGTSGADIHHWYLYDGRGLLRAEIDGEGDLTRYAYDASGYLSQTIAGQKLDPATLLATPPSLATLPSAAAGDVQETISYVNDAFGKVLTATRALASGTETTTYVYDNLQRLVSTTVASATPAARTSDQVFDARGRLVKSLSGVGAAALAALGSSPTQAQIDQVYATYGTSYVYDNDDRLIQSLTPDGAGGGLRTLYYYDSLGRLAYQISPLGEVTGYNYDTFGEVSDTHTYATPIASGALAGLTGGAVTTALTGAITSNASIDADRHLTYDVRGLVKTSTDALGATTNYDVYDAFGDLLQRTDPLTTGTTTTSTTSTFGYDARGLLTSQTLDVGGINARTRYVYDAEGRQIYSVDAVGDVVHTFYDNAGRVTGRYAYATQLNLTGLPATIDASALSGLATSANDEFTGFVYDGAGRLIYSVDATGRATSFQYDNADNLIQTTVYKGLIATQSAPYSRSALDSAVQAVAATGVRNTYNAYDNANRLTFTVNAEGGVSRYVYDADGHVTSTIYYTNPFSGGAVSDSALQSWASTQPVLSQMRTLFDAAGRPVYEVDGVGYVTQIQYDADGRVSARTVYPNPVSVPAGATPASLAALLGSPAGRATTSYSYDTAGRLTDVADPLLIRTHTDYDLDGRVTNETIAYGTADQQITHYERDAAGRVTSKTEGYGKAEAATTHYGYDAFGNVTSVIDGRNIETRNTYDALGRLHTVTNVSTLTGGGDSTTYDRDAFGDINRMQSPNGGVTLYWYDKLNRQVMQVDPLGYATKTTYSVGGQVASVTRFATQMTGVQLGVLPSPTPDSQHDEVTVFTRDLLDRLTATTDAEGYTERYTLDALGRQSTVTNKLGGVTTNVYDADGRLISSTVGIGISTPNAKLYYGDGGSLSTADGTWTFGSSTIVGGQVMFLNGVQKGSAVELVVSGGQTYCRNAAGNWWVYSGGVWQLTANAPAMASVTPTDTVTTTYQYDARGNRTQMVEAAGRQEQRTTNYAYDLDNRLTQVSGGEQVQAWNQDALTSYGMFTPFTVYSYDLRGNLIRTRDVNNCITDTYYDNLNRKIAQIDAAGTYSAWSYDADGNLQSATVYGDTVANPAQAGGTPPAPVNASNSRTTSYKYDADNRQIESRIANVRIGTSSSGVYTTELTDLVTTSVYDRAGDLIQQTDPRQNKSVFYFYDLMGRKVAQVDELNYLTTYQLDGEGNVLREDRFANALTGTVTSSSNPTALKNSVAPSADDRTTTFTYDRMGRRLTETRLNVDTSALNSAGQVISPGLQNSTITYTYNGAGEVLSKQQATGDKTTYIYDSASRLESETLPAFVNYGGQTEQRHTSYLYDGLNNVTLLRVGNMDPNSTSAEYTAYVYGAGGRLASMTDADGNVTTYKYDAGGRRIAEVFSRQTSAGNTLVQERTYKLDGDGRIIQQSYASLSPEGVWAFVDQNSQAVVANNTLYDAYGEVVARGENGLWQETYEYDNAGRIWRSNQGDGSSKVYLYNGSGDLTLEVASDGTGDLSQYANIDAVIGVLTGNGTHNIGDAPVSGLTLTMFVNDARHQQVAERELFRQLSFDGNGGYVTAEIDDQQAYNAFGEVTVETKGNGVDLNAANPATPTAYSTLYTYNTLGEVTQIQRPTADYTDETGAVDYNAAATRATEREYYDISGRLIGEMTPRSNETTWLLQAGSGYQGDAAVKIAEYHQDGSKINYGVNVFGLVRTISYDNQAQPAESFIYDKMNRLVRTNHSAGPNQAATDTSDQSTVYYRYDSQGNQIESWTAALPPPTNNGNITDLSRVAVTDYDVEGRVIRSKALGVSTSYQDAYTTYNYRWSTGEIPNFSGWITQTNGADGTIITDAKDYFGHVWRHTEADLAAPSAVVTINYSYDKAGRLVSDNVSNGRTYRYFNTGNLAVTTFGNTLGADSLETTYGYDKDGNVLTERETAVDPKTTTPVVIEDAQAQYDAQDRVTTLTITAPGAFFDGQYGRPNGPLFLQASHLVDNQPAAANAILSNTLTLNYTYTASGDLRHLNSSYIDPNSGVATTHDDWYAYDVMDRVITANGQFTGAAGSGSVSRGTTGVDILYDTQGRRVMTTVGQVSAAHQETYSYDSLNNVTMVTAIDNGVSHTLSSDTRDALGRLTQHVEYDASGNYVQVRNLTYDDASNVVNDTSWTRTSSGYSYLSSANIYTTDNGGIYRGVLTSTSSTTGTASQFGGSLSGVASQTDTTTFDWTHGGRQSRIDHYKGSTHYFTVFDYNDAGMLYIAEVTDGNPRDINYVTNAQGQVLSRLGRTDGSSPDYWQNSYVFDGRLVADIGATGVSPAIDYAQASQQRYTSPTTLAHANFDEFYQATSPTSGPAEATGNGSIYTVQAGDTLQSIALAQWGDASLWYLLADANGLSGQSTLAAGTLLRVPSNVVNVHNSVRTTTVYNASAALGDVSPTTPAPPKHHGCGVIGQVLVAIVAIAVNAIPGVGPAIDAAVSSILDPILGAADFVTSAAADAIVNVADAAVGGAIGDAAGQGVAIAVGAQQGFSWNSVALAAISAGATVGAPSIPGVAKLENSFGSALASHAINGAIASSITQGVGVATGLQSSFNWTAVAVSATQSAAGYSVGHALNGAFGTTAYNSQSAANLGTNFASGMAGSIAGGVTRSLITGTDFGDNILADLPSALGNTIGNLVASGLEQQQELPAKVVNADGSITYNGPDAIPKNLFAGPGASAPDDSTTVGEVVVTGHRGFWNDLLHGNFGALGGDISYDFSGGRFFGIGGGGSDGPHGASGSWDYTPHIDYHTVTYGRHGPDPRTVTYAKLTNPVIDSSAVNARYGTNVDLSFTIGQEGGVILTPYVPWAPGMSGRSGLTLGAGFDLGQQSQKTWSVVASGDHGLLDEFSSAVGPTVQRQNAVDWQAAHPNLQLTVPQAEAVTQNAMGIYVNRAQNLYDGNPNAPGAFSELSSAQQTVFFDRYYNSSSVVNPTFNSYVYKGDWTGAGNYLRSQANNLQGTVLGARLDAEATLLGH